MPRTALIVTDMLNSYEHDDAEHLIRSVERVLPAIERLIERARDEDVLTIYVNDNFGAWRSSRQELLETALGGEYGAPGGASRARGPARRGRPHPRARGRRGARADLMEINMDADVCAADDCRF